MLNFLYSEWTHPFFISISDYARLMSGTGRLVKIGTDDWTAQTIASWLHSIWVGVFNPIPVLRRPDLWWKTFRDGLTLYRMHKVRVFFIPYHNMLIHQKLNPTLII